GALEVRDGEERVVVKHLLEVRNEPAAVGRIAVKPAAHVIADSAARHFFQGLHDHLERSLVPGPAVIPEHELGAERPKSLEAYYGIAESLEQIPTVVPKMLAAMDFRLDTPKEIVIVKPDREASAEPMLSRLRDVFLPNRMLSVAAEGKEIDAQKSL